MRHINYLSLDIEGAELGALKSIDWKSTTIDAITVENLTPEVKAVLESHGMAAVLCVSLDTLFVRKAYVQAAADWYRAVGKPQLGTCIFDDTSKCFDGKHVKAGMYAVVSCHVQASKK